MSASINALIARYLEEAIAAEKSFEAQLRGFSQEGDDEDVRVAFAAHADETRLQVERLAERVTELGAGPPAEKSTLTGAVEPGPKPKSNLVEERTVQNVIAAYTFEMAECAMYETMAVAAHAAGDIRTEKLARDIQNEERTTAERVWRFLPSRSKIAFNMLTVQEVDPSVETRAQDNRLVK